MALAQEFEQQRAVNQSMASKTLAETRLLAGFAQFRQN